MPRRLPPIAIAVMIALSPSSATADVRVASKNGALDGLGSDVEIVYTAGGPIAMAVTIHSMPVVDYSPDNAGSELIWAISQIVQDAPGAARPL
jgi:hypothetical protein